MKTQLERTISSHRQWLNSNGPRVFARDRQYLLQDIAARSREAFLQIPDSLDGLATFYGIRGIVGLYDGNEQAWNDISTSIDFRGWSLRIRATSFFDGIGPATVNLSNHASTSACLICVSEKWAPLAEGILLRMMADRSAVDSDFWTRRRFEPFVLWCCRDHTNIKLIHPPKPPYSLVCENWHDTEGLSSSLASVASYHDENMIERESHGNAEFKYPPFDILPCEVMLINRVRAAVGLPTVVFPHPLDEFINGRVSVAAQDAEHELLEFLPSLESHINSRAKYA